MTFRLSLIFSAFWCLVVAQDSDLSDIAGVKLVIVGMRNGNHHPRRFVPGDPNDGKWGFEGPLQLSNIGKRQAYSLGQKLNNRYGTEQYFPNRVKAVSSSTERSQMTIQTMLSGLFPPSGREIWNAGVLWQPKSATSDDAMLGINSGNCPTFAKVSQPMNDENLDEMRNLVEENQEVVNYVSENTGWNASFSSMGDLADNIVAWRSNGLTAPDWVNKPTLDKFDADNIVALFLDGQQEICSSLEPCRDIVAGYWLNQIAEILEKKRDSGDSPLKYQAYASQGEVILSLMKLLSVDIKQLPPSAGFILEYKDDPYPAVRLLYHQANPDNADDRIIQIAPLTDQCVINLSPVDWCPLPNFIERFRYKMTSDWKSACRVQECPFGTAKLADFTKKEKTLDCSAERDESGTVACTAWRKQGFCDKYNSFKYLYCRKSCLCGS